MIRRRKGIVRLSAVIAAAALAVMLSACGGAAEARNAAVDTADIVTTSAAEATEAEPDTGGENASAADETADAGEGTETETETTMTEDEEMEKEITAVWMWTESISGIGADSVFDDCANAGVTDVYLLTKGLKGTVAFDTPLAPPAVRGRDILREALDAAHARGIRVHAWFTSASDATYKSEHPESGLCHYVRKRDNDVISMNDEGYALYMESVITDLVKRYDVDGIHLDYIRYNHLTYGWSEDDYADLESRGADVGHIKELMDKTFYGASPDGTSIFDAYRAGDEDVLILAAKRREDVCRFAERLTAAARAERPDIILSAALMPEGAFTSDLAFPDLHYGQNYADLSRIFDVFLPMAYSKAYSMSDSWVGEATRGALGCGVKVVTGIQCYDGGSIDSMKRDSKAALDSGADGICLFRYGTDEWKRAVRVWLTERE